MGIGADRMERKDRTTRFAIVLTLLGGLIFLFKNSFSIWFNMFDNIAYTRTAISMDHFIVIVFFSMVVSIAIYVTKYLHSELKTLQYTDDNEHNSLVDQADKNFESIFRVLKYNCYLVISVIGVYGIYGLFKSGEWKLFLISFFGGTVLAVILFIVIFSLKKLNLPSRTNSRNASHSASLNEKAIPIGFFIYIAILVSLISFSITLNAIEGDKKVEIIIEDNNDSIPIVINTQNITNLNVELIVRQGESLADVIKKNTKDFRIVESSVQVFNSNEKVSQSIDLSKINNDWDKENFQVYLRKSKVSFNLSLPIIDLLKEGTNRLELLVIATLENGTTKNVYFSTDILKDQENIEIIEKGIKLDL